VCPLFSSFVFLSFDFLLSFFPQKRAARFYAHTHTHTRAPNAFRVSSSWQRQRDTEKVTEDPFDRERVRVCIQREREGERSQKGLFSGKNTRTRKKKRKEKATTKRRRGKSAEKKRKRITADDDIDDDEIERLFWPLRGRVEDKHQ